MSASSPPPGERFEPAARTPMARIAAVAAFSLRGVIHLGERAANQTRPPVAAAPTVIAVAMHCMHIRAM
jgi:hypothetical protein